MSRETGLSPASVMRIWHAFGIKPHLEKTFKRSTDPLFFEKVHDIVGLYLNPGSSIAYQSSSLGLKNVELCQ